MLMLKKEGLVMIKLTKLNNAEFVLNSQHIQVIESIPETKVDLTNKDYYIVKEKKEEVVEKIIEFNARVCKFFKEVVIKEYEE